MKHHRNFSKISIAAIAFALIALPASNAAASLPQKKAATENAIISGNVTHYQQTLPNAFKVYLKDGSVWEGRGNVRRSYRPKDGNTPAVTLTPKDNNWLLQFEGLKRKYKVKRLK